MKTDSFERLQGALPGILIGMGIAIAWWVGIGYLLVIRLYMALWEGGFNSPLFLLTPPLSVVGVALIFSYFKKHNVVTGILLVSIGFSLYTTLPLAKGAIQQIGTWHADARR